MENNCIRHKRDMNCKGHFPDNGIHQGDWEGSGQNSQWASISFLHFNNFGGEKKVRLTNSKEVFSCQSEFAPSLYLLNRLLVWLWTGDDNQQGLNEERKLLDSFDFC